MAISVRERMPLRLNWTLLTPAGRRYRWGSDDPSAGRVAQQESISTAMPGGFDKGSVFLARNPRQDYPDLKGLSTLTAEGVGGQVAWQGRVEDLPSTYDPGSAGFTPQAVGWQAHLDDDQEAGVLYISRNLTEWAGPSTTRQLALIAGGFATDFFSTQALADAGGAPCLQLSGQGPLPAGSQSSDNWLDSGEGNRIRYVQFSGIAAMNSAVGSGGFVPVIGGGADDSALSASTPLAGTGATVIDLASIGGPYRYAVLIGIYNGGAAGSEITYGWQFQNLAAIGDHGLSLHAGVSGASPGVDDGFLASDIFAHALGAWGPLLSFTTGENGSIQPSLYPIAQAAYPGPTSVSAIVRDAAKYELLDWAVWEGALGPTFYSNFRGQAARARHWRARVGPAALQPTGPQVSRMYNGVVVSWTGVDGKAYRIGPAQDSRLLDSDPQNPVNQIPRLKRYAPLAMNGTSSLQAAVKAGQYFLAEQKLLSSSGQATHSGWVADDHGVLWPAWKMRAGDDVSYIDAADRSPRRIVSTGYSGQQRANTVQLDQPPDTLQAVLERLGASLIALGMS